MKFSCHKCNRVIDDKIETVWNLVSGWEKKRDQGGTNHLALRTPQDLYCCNGCMTLLLAELDPARADAGSGVTTPAMDMVVSMEESGTIFLAGSAIADSSTQSVQTLGITRSWQL